MLGCIEHVHIVWTSSCISSVRGRGGSSAQSAGGRDVSVAIGCNGGSDSSAFERLLLVIINARVTSSNKNFTKSDDIVFMLERYDPLPLILFKISFVVTRLPP